MSMSITITRSPDYDQFGTPIVTETSPAGWSWDAKVGIGYASFYRVVFFVRYWDTHLTQQETTITKYAKSESYYLDAADPDRGVISLNATFYYTGTSITATFNANGGTISASGSWSGSGNSASKSVTNGSTYGTIPTGTAPIPSAGDTIKRSGWYFNGWYPGNVTSESTMMSSSAVTLTANWAYYVQMNANGSNVSGMPTYPFADSTRAGAEGETKYITSIVPSRDGYAFIGWNTSADGSGYSYSPGSAYTGPSATLYAQWSGVAYTITTSVSPAGKGTVTGGGSVAEGASYTLRATAVAGYEFGSWSGGISGNTTPYTGTMGQSNLSVTANFVGIEYTIAYNKNASDATGSTASSTHTYDVAKALTANGFSRSGYTFQGWATSASGPVVYTNGQSVTNLSSTQGSTVTLYAVWGPFTQTGFVKVKRSTGWSTANIRTENITP